MARWRRAQRGSFFLWALGLNAIVLLVVVSLHPFFQTVVRVSAFSHRYDQARQLAEAGLSAALWEFNAGGADWDAGSGWSGTGCYQKTAELQGPSGSAGWYEVTACPDDDPPTITSTGSVPTIADPQAQETVRVTLESPSSTLGFEYGMFAGGFSEHYYLVDSYDSTLGAYGADLGDGVLNIGENGDVGGNGDGWSSPFALTIPSVTKGTAYITPGATYNGDPADATGGLVERAALTLPPIEIPAAALNATSNGNLLLTGTTTQTANCNAEGIARYTSVVIQDSATLVLPPGCTLYVDGKSLTHNLETSVDAGIEAQGGNRIYLEGSFLASGSRGIQSMTQSPHDLLIFAKNLDFSDAPAKSEIYQPTFYGAVYVEYGRLHSDARTDEFFGSLMAGPEGVVSIYYSSIPSGEVHYDESLRTFQVSGASEPAGNEYRIQSWSALDPSGS